MQTIFALDLGTTKFCIARYDNRDNCSPITITTCPSRGMKRGMLSDFKKVTEGIRELIEAAENKFKTDIRHVVVGVAGSHLRGRIIESEIAINEPQITKRTLDKLKLKAEASSMEPSRELLHLLPIAYFIDDRDSTPNPLGFSGRKIKSRHFMIDSDQLYLRDMLNAVNQAGIEVLNLYAEPFASSCVTVPQNAKNLGIAIADIGGGTTDGIIFTNGMPSSCFTFNIGGLMMTNDIAIGINLPFGEAEKAKNFFGLSGEKSDYSLTLQGIHDKERIVTGHDIQKILGHRVFEWADELASKLSPYRGRLGAGIFLTGGGSQILSLTAILERQFHIPVKTTFPSFNGPKSGSQFASKYATVIGLLQLEMNKRIDAGLMDKNSWKFPFLRNLASWVKELS